jgi:cyclic-di-GMP-binding protein
MGFHLQRLRELLPFSQPHPPSQADGVSARHNQSPTRNQPLAALAHLYDEVLPPIIRQSNLHMRIKLLDEARQEAEKLLLPLESEISQAALPLPPSATAAALQADNLLKRLTQAYADTARKIFRDHHASFANLLHRATERAMSLVARRQLLAYRAYALPSANSWLLLHELYRMTCDPRSKPLNGETAPIEHEYLGALLFAFLEPNKLPRNELDIVHRCTRQLAAYAVVAEATSELLTSKSTDACFLVRPADGAPGFPLTRLPSETNIAGGLIVDCTQVLAALDRNLARSPGKPVQPELSASPVLLQSLRVAIGGRSARRFSRTKFRPRADLIGGLDQVIEFLDGHAFSRRAHDSLNRQESQGFSTSEWSLIDESPDGFLIRFIKGNKCQFGAGDIVVLQPRESSRTHVCLIRRIASARNRLELGLQLLSPQVSVVTLAANGSAATRAIFLHSLPAYGPHTGLIVAPGHLAKQQTLSFTTLGRKLEKQVGRTLEANEGLEFVTLEPLPH